MSKLKKRSAAAKKTWRVRKRMQAARQVHSIIWRDGTEEFFPIEELEKQFLTKRAKSRLPNPFLEIGKQS